MLDIVLKILSICGITLLILLGILLVLVLLALFFPITYRISGEKSEETATFKLKINWLFGLLRARFYYPEPGKFIVKILWFTLSGSKPDTIKNIDKPVKPQTLPVENSETDIQNNETVQDEPVHTENSAGDESKPKKSISSLLIVKIEKIKYTILKIYDKIKHIFGEISFYRELLQDEQTKGLFHHALDRLKKILKSIRPRKLKADILFGTGSPDTTGYAYGAYGMFSAVLGKHIIVTPDFTQSIFCGEFYAAGHITVFQIVFHSLCVIFDKRLRLLITKIRNHKKQ